MERLLGIHRDKIMPRFAEETFNAWFKRTGIPAAPAEPNAKIAIFHTCFVNFYNPDPGKALVKVLAKNGCEIINPPQNCCGMPALDGGDVEVARKEARQNVAQLLPYVRRGYRIAAINPTCSMTLRHHYPQLLGTPEANEVAKAAADPHEVLYELRRAGKFNKDFRSTPGKVAYQVPCHLKAQRIGLRSRELLRQIPGTEIVTVDACTAHDGTWAMKKENFELSMKCGERAFEGMRDAEAAIMATDCPLAAIQILQGTGVRPLNPAEILARAYEPGGFPIALGPRPPAAPSDPG
jgi:glycerol-3-phosphate dehydrogenase subunit C